MAFMWRFFVWGFHVVTSMGDSMYHIVDRTSLFITGAKWPALEEEK
jgi:hypothetical protein